MAAAHSDSGFSFQSIINPKKQITMKQLCVFAAVALVCAACTSDPDNNMESVTNEQQRVTLSFAPSVTTEPMGAKALTRAAVPVSDVVSRLDIWLFEGDSAKALTQTTPDGVDDDFPAYKYIGFCTDFDGDCEDVCFEPNDHDWTHLDLVRDILADFDVIDDMMKEQDA